MEMPFLSSVSPLSLSSPTPTYPASSHSKQGGGRFFFFLLLSLDNNMTLATHSENTYYCLHYIEKKDRKRK